MKNEPAFPTAKEGPNYLTHHGITMRDFFAAAALTGLISQPTFSETSPEHLAEWAYQQADAMLGKRNATQE